MIPLFLPQGKKLPDGIGELVGKARLPGYQRNKGGLQEDENKETGGLLYRMRESEWQELDAQWSHLERIEVWPLFWSERVPAESYRAKTRV